MAAFGSAVDSTVSASSSVAYVLTDPAVTAAGTALIAKILLEREKPSDRTDRFIIMQRNTWPQDDEPQLLKSTAPARSGTYPSA